MPNIVLLLTFGSLVSYELLSRLDIITKLVDSIGISTHSLIFLSGVGFLKWRLVFPKDVQELYCLLQQRISLTVRWFQPNIQSRMEQLYVLILDH